MFGLKLLQYTKSAQLYMIGAVWLKIFVPYEYLLVILLKYELAHRIFCHCIASQLFDQLNKK
jgi:hypothetical protein